MKSTLKAQSQLLRKEKLEEAFRDAVKARDAGLAAVVAAQLRQYVGRVRHA